MNGQQVRNGKKAVTVLRALYAKSDKNMQIIGQDNSKAYNNFNCISARYKCSKMSQH
jgi:hypothetical protein